MLLGHLFTVPPLITKGGQVTKPKNIVRIT